MSTDAAHKRWWQIFEVIVGVPFLVGIGPFLAVYSWWGLRRDPDQLRERG